MVLANKTPMAQRTCRSVADFKYEASGAGLFSPNIVQMLEQRLLDIVAFPDHQPVPGIRQPINTRLSRDETTHSSCVKGPGRHLIKRQR